jgi:hypothetical protein
VAMAQMKVRRLLLAARRVAVLIFDSTNSTQYISIHPTQKTSFAI